MISQKNRKKFKKKMLKFRLMEFHKELIKKKRKIYGGEKSFSLVNKRKASFGIE